VSKLEKFEVETTRKRLGDLFITTMESGYSPWVHKSVLVSLEFADPKAVIAHQNSTTISPDLVWWGHDTMYEGEFTIELVYDREEDEEGAAQGQRRLNPADFIRGLAVLAKESPYKLGEFLHDNEDGPCADCWLQCVVFGKVIYG